MYKGKILVIFKGILIVFLLAGAFALAAAAFFLWKACKMLREKPIRALYEKRSAEPGYVYFSEMPEQVIRIFVFLEDKEFFTHHGINLKFIRLTIKYNLTHPGAQYGGSTITQQLVKNLYFSFEAVLSRKILEAIIALQMEKELNKQQILELYLNVICYDNGQYGISSAAEFYFGKKVQEMTWNEIFMIASLLPVVGIYNPFREPSKFCSFRNRKAKALRDENYLTAEEYREIVRHTEKNMDEDLIWPDAALPKKFLQGPMINEKYGPGSPWQREMK